MKEPIGTRLYKWINERAHVSPAVDHMKKKEVAQHRHSMWYYFGGFALFLLAVQIVTGIILLLRYEPSATPASDPVTGKRLCMVRATDSILVAEVQDSTLLEYSKGEEVAFKYSGVPDSGLPDELKGKVKIKYTIPKDSVMIVPYTVSAVLGVDTSAPVDTSASADASSNMTANIAEIPDVPKIIVSYVSIIRDTTMGTILYPSAAFVSVQHIMQDVPLGGVIRSVHAYGANLMVACILLHMFSTFLMKGYRRPHEMMWMSGVLLLAVVMGFGFTGYLLPWTKLSYFATRVGVTYPESFIPGIGKFIADVMRGGGEVTGETLSRMFDMHVVVLPLSVLLLVGIHMALLQVHGTNSPVGVQQSGMNVSAAGIGAISFGVIALYKFTTKSFDFTSPWFIIPITILPVVAGFFLSQILLGSGKTEDGKRRAIPFYWNFAMRDYIGWLIGLAVLVAIAIYAPWHVEGDVGMPIDLSKPLVTPVGIHPEWYYMFAFELLRLIPGDIAMILIGIGGAVWFVIPFLDRDSQHERKSPRYTLIGIVLIVGFLGLTWLAYQAVDDEVRQAQMNEHVK